MDLLFQKAKNDEITVKYNNNFLHSNYNPSKEAERFIESISLPYIPEIVFFTEPALSYCIKYFKQKYPEIKTGVIRYVKGFEDYNSDFDYVINYYEHLDNFADYFSSLFNEEQILSTYFINWKPSTSVFPETDQKVWLFIKQIMDNAKTLLVTRQYFEKKWLVNTFNFAKYVKNQVSFNKKVEKPVLIISSGPSLKDALPVIKENREKFFIIALSSSISLLLKNNILPDLLMSTDGGFWAGEHLKKIIKYEIPLALPTEAFCKKSVLSKINILPLQYSDGISNLINKKTPFNFMMIERNGTVSGSALQFALNLTKKEVFFCGLDMSSQKGFQHSQPNEIEINSSLKDFKINSKELRSVRSENGSSTLQIYLNWFKNLNLHGRTVYRIINNNFKKNTLGQIKDIDTTTFDNLISDYNTTNNENFYSYSKINFNLNSISDYIEKLFISEDWKEKLFPLDFVSLKHNPQNQDLLQKIETRNNNLINKLRKIYND